MDTYLRDGLGCGKELCRTVPGQELMDAVDHARALWPVGLSYALAGGKGAARENE